MHTKSILAAVVLVVVSLAAGFYLGRASDGASFAETVEMIAEGNRAQQSTQTSTSSASEVAVGERPDLTEEERRLLESHGIDPESVTPAMVACAREKLSTARFEALARGAELTTSERLSLIACYRS
jgi:hypothetical protein